MPSLLHATCPTDQTQLAGGALARHMQAAPPGAC
jgi:hypothetical protein